MWQTIFGSPLYETDTLMVRQNALFRWLIFKTYQPPPASPSHTGVQTLIHRYFPAYFPLAYIPAMTLAYRSTPGNVCLLGLGGGGIAHALQPYRQHHLITAIEYQQSMIEVALTYFKLKHIRALDIIHQEAYAFLQQTQTSFQHVLVDLNDGLFFPKSCSQADFFKRCYACLVPQGSLAINIANPHEYQPILTHLRSCFGVSTLAIPIPKTTNVVVIAYKHPSIEPLVQTLLTQQRLRRLIWDPSWGYMSKI